MTHLQYREQAADRLRDGLMLSLRELERRRQRYTPEALGARARESTALKLGGALTLGTLVGGVVALVVWQRRRHRPTARFARRMRQRRDTLRRIWKHPDLLTEPAEPRLRDAAVRKVALILVGTLATALAGRMADRIRPPR